MLLFKIASRLGIIVSRLEKELDYSEFLEWEKYFEHELKAYDRKDYQLAQIAMYCHMPVSDKKEFDVNEYLIEFKMPDTEKPSPEILIKMLQSAFGIGGK